MLHSMTGYGAAKAESDDLQVDVEIKTLNSKFLDINLRIPRLLNSKEIELRNLLSQELIRGKVSFSIVLQFKNAELVKRDLNRALFDAYHKDLSGLVADYQMQETSLLGQILAMPDVLETADTELSAEQYELCLKATKEALRQVKEFRQVEGEGLLKELLGYLANINQGLLMIDEVKGSRLEKVRERIREFVESSIPTEKIDSFRFEQELLYFIERLDITEEIVRLRSHLEYFEREASQQSTGKRLQFISQEMGREINTIGSKANDDRIQHAVVRMKDELEKIKEQVLNII